MRISIVRVWVIPVVRIIIPVVGVIIPKGISKKETALVPEMISVLRKVRSLVFCEAMAGKGMPGKPREMASATTMPTAKAATSSTMATATTSSTMCKHGGGRERQNAGHNQTNN